MQKENPITRVYELLIAHAHEEIALGHMYFNPQGKILETIKGRLREGVRVDLITNGILDTSPGVNALYGWATRIHYVPLFYGEDYSLFRALTGISDPLKETTIYEFAVPNVIYHKKVGVFDRRTLIIGSYNLGRKSHQADYELALMIDDTSLAETALEVLEKDRQISQRVSPEQATDWYFNPAIAYLAGMQKQFHGFL